MFESIGKLVGQPIGKTGENARRVAAAVVLEKASRALLAVFGPDSVGNLTPVSFRDGQLTVSVRHGVWSQDLALRREETAKAVNREFGKEIIKKIVIR